jgi:hypothetical protein
MIESPSDGSGGEKIIQIKLLEDTPMHVRGGWSMIKVGKLDKFLYQILYVIFLDK